jgi:hypothetical protein
VVAIRLRRLRASAAETAPREAGGATPIARFDGFISYSHDPNDYVRYELAKALQREVQIIPVTLNSRRRSAVASGTRTPRGRER